jgi:hypothetical protein
VIRFDWHVNPACTRQSNFQRAAVWQALLPRAKRNQQRGRLRKVSQPYDAVIRVYDEAGNVIETHEHAGEFREF